MKIRRNGFVFVTWIGDHEPRHVHVYDGRGKALCRWDLERWRQMDGAPVGRRVVKALNELRAEGVL